MIELIDRGDCLQIQAPDGWINVYPEEDVEAMVLPEIIPLERHQEAREILARCKAFNEILVSDAEAENELFAQAVAVIEAEEEEKRVQAAMEAMRRLGIK